MISSTPLYLERVDIKREEEKVKAELKKLKGASRSAMLTLGKSNNYAWVVADGYLSASRFSSYHVHSLIPPPCLTPIVYLQLNRF